MLTLEQYLEVKQIESKHRPAILFVLVIEKSFLGEELTLLQRQLELKFTLGAKLSSGKGILRRTRL